MKGKRLSRKERERERQRREIMAAAHTLFSEKGYHGVSMQEIADQAEFAVGTLYNFFKSKGDLYQESMLEETEKFMEQLGKVLDEPVDEVAKLRNLVRAKRTYFLNNASKIRIFHAELRQASDSAITELDLKIQTKRLSLMKDVAAVFESGMKKGTFQRIGDPYILAKSLDNITHSFLLSWIEDPEQYPYPEDPDVILNILFKGLIQD